MAKYSTLTIPKNLDPHLYAKVKKVIEDFGGRWCRKTQTHLFPAHVTPGSPLFTASSFLNSLTPLPDEARKTRKIIKRSARLANVHRVWKLIAPIVIRRTKAGCGEDIVPKTMKPIIIQPGTAQWAVYSHHFDHPPIAAKHGGRGKKLDRRNQIGMQLTNLRLAATCPHHEGLAEVITGVNGGTARSWTDANPKQAAILSLCADLLDRGEQVLIGSPFRSFNRSLHARLAEAGVACVLLDGQTSQERRGELAGQFKEHRFSVAVAGLDAMAEGHSFAQCAHLIQPSFSFCLDVNAQFPDRIWRLDSPRPVTIYTMVTRGTVDEAVLALYKDKLGSSQLALDGQLTEETIEQVDLAALLEEVVRNFDPQQATVDEQDIEAQWPALKRRLGYAEVRYREFHPPIIGTLVNSTDVTGAVNALAAPSPSPMAVHLARIRAKRGRVRH